MTEPNRLEAALLRTMTLLASLNVASEVVRGIRDRKAGRDPSTDEDHDEALPSLIEDLRTLKELAFQLQSSLALWQQQGEQRDIDAFEDAPEAAIPVSRFIDLVRIQKAGNTLHRVHQRLLSLYPSIDASFAEEARRLKNRCDQLNECTEAEFTYTLTGFVEATSRFTFHLQRAL